MLMLISMFSGVVVMGVLWFLIAFLITRSELRDLAARENEMRADLAREALLATRAYVDRVPHAREARAGVSGLSERIPWVGTGPWPSQSKGFKR